MSKQEQLCLSYRTSTWFTAPCPALRDINWSLQPGQQWACLGPNGAGKTSLATGDQSDRQRISPATVTTLCHILQENGVAYVCFEQAKALCERDKKLDDSEFRADASDPGTTVAGGDPGMAELPMTAFIDWC